jgi:hypothetical protein
MTNYTSVQIVGTVAYINVPLQDRNQWRVVTTTKNGGLTMQHNDGRVAFILGGKKRNSQMLAWALHQTPLNVVLQAWTDNEGKIKGYELTPLITPIAIF